MEGRGEAMSRDQRSTDSPLGEPTWVNCSLSLLDFVSLDALLFALLLAPCQRK
jgi:hypothetical protein